MPFVHGTPMTHAEHLHRAGPRDADPARDSSPTIVDAIEPGGSGDMYAGLTTEQREALAEVTRMGFPPRAWFDVERVAARLHGRVHEPRRQHRQVGHRATSRTSGRSPATSGANPTESLLPARVQHKTTVDAGRHRRARPTELGLADGDAARSATAKRTSPRRCGSPSFPRASLLGAALKLTSGAAAGHVLYIADVLGDLVMTGFGEAQFDALCSIAAGDEVVLDNAVYLAFQTYHRHQVPGPEYPVWDQFLSGGQPIYPQRPALMGTHYARKLADRTERPLRREDDRGPDAHGRGRVPVAGRLVPRARSKRRSGRALDDHYRLWFVDHAMHTGADGDAW